MKKFITLVFILMISLVSYGQKLKGTWILGHKIIDHRAIDIKETKIIEFNGDYYYISEIDLWGNIKPGTIRKRCDFKNYEFTSPGTMVVVDHFTGAIEFWVKIDRLGKNIKKEIKYDKRRIKKRVRRGFKY